MSLRPQPSVDCRGRQDSSGICQSIAVGVRIPAEYVSRLPWASGFQQYVSGFDLNASALKSGIGQEFSGVSLQLQDVE